MLNKLKIAIIPTLMTALMISWELTASATTVPSPTPVPEPTMNLLIGGALMYLGYVAFRRNQK